jgi:hypothetical protein
MKDSSESSIPFRMSTQFVEEFIGGMDTLTYCLMDTVPHHHDNIGWSPVSNINQIHEILYGAHGYVHLRPYENQTSLWTNMAKHRNSINFRRKSFICRPLRGSKYESHAEGQTSTPYSNSFILL